jgi:hypothetical protein
MVENKVIHHFVLLVEGRIRIGSRAAQIMIDPDPGA